MKKQFFIWLFFLIDVTLVAQQYNFKTYNVDDGLTQSQVLTIHQDTRGFIWVGTLGGGISRFDGHNFTNYTIYDGLPSNQIWKIFCDSKGNIWVGTSNGLALFREDRFVQIKDTYGLRDDQIYDITEDDNGNIFIGTKNYGVFVYNGVKYKNYAINDGIGFSSVVKLYKDNEGIIWLGSNGYGLAKYDGKKFENISYKMNMSGQMINEIYTDIKGRLIVATDEGMFRKQGNVFLPFEKLFDTKLISSVVIDKNQTTWYGTYGDGLISESKTGKISYYHEENGLPSNFIFQLFIGGSEKLWIATDGAGFSRYDGKKFIHYNKSNILVNNIVKSILKDDNGLTWFATEEGLVIYDEKNESRKILNNKNGLQDDNVHALSYCEDGSVWCGSENGVSKIVFEKGSFQIEYFQLNARILSVFAEGKNKIWIGSDDGIMYYNGKDVLKRFKDSIPDLQINRIRTNKKGDILFCADMAFSIYDGSKLRNLKISDEKGTKEVMDVCVMPNGDYWLATDRGITMLDSEFNKSHFTSKDGLTSDNLYLIAYFKDEIWVGGDRGLDRLHLSHEMEITNVKNYSRDDGFVGIECNSGAVFIEKDKLWFGTIKGVTVFQSEFDEQNEHLPKIHLLNLMLNYETVNWNDLFKDISVINGIPQDLILPHNYNNLTFSYVAIDFVNPEKLLYQYKLEGFDPDWRPITNETSVSYTNIPPGEYIFKLKAINSDGKWSDVYSYAFEIRVPFWRSTLFFVILIPTILFLIYVFILLRTRQLNKTKRKLEETVRVRTRELNRQKLELEKLSIVADKMNDGVLICDINGKIDWINDGFKRMAGVEPDEFDLFHFAPSGTLQEISSHEEIGQIIDNFKYNPEPVIYDSTHKLMNGSYVWTRAALTPIYGENKKLQKIVALYTDITNHIQYEETLAQTNKDLTDSILYAKKIQEAILPDKKMLDEIFEDNFIYYNPRDIVSGDFYWFHRINAFLVIGVADCTGHGVPGAFMSMIGNEFLHQLINNSSVSGPDSALKLLNERVTKALHQDGGETASRDGMDIALIAINMTNLFCQYSGAFIPMFIVRDGKLLEYEATKESIGGYKEIEKDFIAHELNLQKGDCIYFSTDGFIDQFGGEHGKKYMRKRFKEFILKNHHLPMNEQYALFYEEHHNWRGTRKQTDDILILGIRIS